VGKLIIFFIIIVIISILISPWWNFGLYMERFIKGREISSDNIRISQHQDLMQGFANVPILGSGFGKGVTESRYSSRGSWRYELTYSKNLYNTGLLGIIIYFGCIIWIYIVGFKLSMRDKTKDPTMISLLVGMSGLLIANAVNPYNSSYDLMWFIFLPIAYINLKLQKNNN